MRPMARSMRQSHAPRSARVNGNVSSGNVTIEPTQPSVGSASRPRSASAATARSGSDGRGHDRAPGGAAFGAYTCTTPRWCSRHGCAGHMVGCHRAFTNGRVELERGRVDLGDHAGGRSIMSGRLESVTFTSGDGETNVPSYLATPDGRGPYPVVLILRGVAGPDDGYTEIALRLAEWGYVALVHGWKVRGTDPTDEPVYADLRGAMTFLGAVGQADLKRLAVFGFCRG